MYVPIGMPTKVYFGVLWSYLRLNFNSYLNPTISRTRVIGGAKLRNLYLLMPFNDLKWSFGLSKNFWEVKKCILGDGGACKAPAQK